ncbi:MAG: sulfotransferase [Proteobacteria bacterium]|nr:sulfotransferase [Pseudomonadota bacterium]
MSERPIVFVLGVPRSGTTLLRLMLAGHPGLFSPPEMVLAPFRTMAERHDVLQRRYWEKGGLRRTFMELEGLDVDAAKERVAGLMDKTVPEVYALVQQLIGDRILVDKCPHLCGLPEALQHLDSQFPEARFLWILRNPGSVIRSFQNVNMAEVLFEGYPYEHPEELWRKGNLVIRDFLAGIPSDRWTRFTYEDMVRESERVMRRICATLGLDFAPAMIEPYKGDRMLKGPKGARAVGDPNTATRSKIDPALADKWLQGFDHRNVSAETKAVAGEFGYDLAAIPLPSIAHVSQTMSGLLDAVRDIEANINMPHDLDNLEGRRFLLRTLSAGIDTFTEYNDADRPHFHQFIGPIRKMYGDCPDCDYWRAPIRVGPGRVYRLTGCIAPGTTYVGMLLHGRGGRMGRGLNDNQLELDMSGGFEVLISTEQQEGIWLSCDGDETELVVRQYYGDRAVEKPTELHIELLGEVPAPKPLDAATYAKGLERSQRMLRAVYQRITQAYERIVKAPIKRFYALPGDSLFPTPDNLYQMCWYRFGPDQAFVVRGKLPTARYFSLCLYNAWMESLDYTRHTITLNHSQIQTDADGHFTVVLADSDPGVPNWLDTAGHSAGYLLARSLLLDGEPAELTTETVWLAEMAEVWARDQSI